MSLYLGNHPFVKPTSGNNTDSIETKEYLIKAVRAYVLDNKKLEETSGGGADCHSQSDGHWIVDTPISTPMSIYEVYKSSRKSWGIDSIGTMIVEIELNDNTHTKGYGVSIGGEPGCFIIEKHFSRFVEGQSIYNIELIWEQLFRSSLNYGRKGLTIQALSAIDLALWDALGKYKKEPVYNLLGGKTKQKLPVYATTVRPDIAQALGFHGAKIPLPYGPSDGDYGLNANIKRIQQCCKSIKKVPSMQSGQDSCEQFPLMLDCYMSLTVPYTLELLNKINKEVINDASGAYNHVKIKWIEEFLPPDDYSGYKKVYDYVKSSNELSGILLTCGEHEYTRYGFKQLLGNNGGIVDVLQPDITWMGGITEARRVIAMAAACDVPVIPHGSSVYSYHLQIAFTNCPMVEFLMLAPKADKIVPLFGDLFVDEPLPENGYITLDENKYGFGVTLNPELKLRRPYTHEEKSLTQILSEKYGKVVNKKEWLTKHSKGPAKVNNSKL